jgi:hypothetical protein
MGKKPAMIIVLPLYNHTYQFTTVPNDLPSLGTHLESLASRYPAEPVERAALRFCESVARWRGKPELETVSPCPVSLWLLV